MAELLLTSSLDPIKTGELYPNGVRLPRHVTIWQQFSVPDAHMPSFIEDVGKTVEGFSPLEVLGTQEAYFGKNNDVPVRRVMALGRGATLMALHATLGSVIEDYEGEFKHPYWAYEGYNPHVTYVNNRALNYGEHAVLRTVELVQRAPETQVKYIRNIWEL